MEYWNAGLRLVVPTDRREGWFLKGYYPFSFYPQHKFFPQPKIALSQNPIFHHSIIPIGERLLSSFFHTFES
jgi:hypothetical protein